MTQQDIYKKSSSSSTNMSHLNLQEVQLMKQVDIVGGGLKQVLVGGLNHPLDKNMSQNGFIFPKDRVKIKKHVSCHHHLVAEACPRDIPVSTSAASGASTVNGPDLKLNVDKIHPMSLSI